MLDIESAIDYIEAWGHITRTLPDSQIEINWMGDKTETVTPQRAIELANEIWNANEGINNE